MSEPVKQRVSIVPEVKAGPKKGEPRSRVRVRTPNQPALVVEDSDGPDLLAGRSIAYKTPDSMIVAAAKPEVSRFGRRRSRFWFQLSTIEQEVQERKEQFKPKVLEHVDASVQKRLTKFKAEFPPHLDNNIDRIREFFLTEVAPLTLAASGGVIQGKEVVEQMVGSAVDTAILDRFEQMVNKASVIKIALFVLQYFDLPEDYLPVLFGSSMNQETDLSKLMSMLKDSLAQPRQDPRGYVNGTTSGTPNQGQIGRAAAERRNRSSRR